MSIYADMVPRCNSNFGMGALLFVEMHRRILGGAFGRIPKPLQQDCWDQPGYILDAPDAIPGGGCYFDEFAPPDDDGERNWIVSQVLVEREQS